MSDKSESVRMVNDLLELTRSILQECDNFKRIHFNLILQFTEFVPNVLNMRANTTYFGTRHFFHSRF